MRVKATSAAMWVVMVLAAWCASAARGQGAPGAGGAGAQPLLPAQGKAALIRLHAPVDDMMLESLKRRVEVARKAGCTLVIYELDTLGGLVTSTLAIDKFTKRLPGEHMNVVAWINDKAYSGGAFIALSCQQVVMASHASLGDCAPIVMDWSGQLQPMPVAERAKRVSPLLEDLDDSADQNHLDKTLLHAMVVPEIEIHRVQNNVTGETRYVDTAAKEKLLAEEVAGPGGVKARPWHFAETVDTEAQLLTVNAETAQKMGLSKGTVDSEQELRAALNIRGELLVLDFNWTEVATVWLTQWWVRLMLFVAMLVLAWTEFSHPGLSIPGIAAVICLLLLVGAPFLTGLAQAWEIVVIVLGLVIIVADLVVYGGVGMLALPGFLLMAVGLVASFVPAEPGGGFVPTLGSTWTALETGMGVVVFGSLLSIVAFVVLAKYLYITPGFRRLQLAPGAGAAMPRTEVQDVADRPVGEAVFAGAFGVAATDLRPAGKARFDEHLVDVVSVGSFIERGTEVEVVSVSGNRVVVRLRA